MTARAPRGWLFTFGLAALAVAAGMVVRATSPPPAPSAAEASELDRCVRYGPVECCFRPEDAD